MAPQQSTPSPTPVTAATQAVQLPGALDDLPETSGSKEDTGIEVEVGVGVGVEGQEALPDGGEGQARAKGGNKKKKKRRGGRRRKSSQSAAQALQEAAPPQVRDVPGASTLTHAR